MADFDSCPATPLTPGSTVTLTGTADCATLVVKMAMNGSPVTPTVSCSNGRFTAKAVVPACHPQGSNVLQSTCEDVNGSDACDCAVSCP